MEALRALIYAVAIFVALGIIALIVAGIMKLLYSSVHRSEKQAPDSVETKTVSQ
jgi:hypothetical protein